MGMVTISFETGGRKGFGPINDSRPSLCATTPSWNTTDTASRNVFGQGYPPHPPTSGPSTDIIPEEGMDVDRDRAARSDFVRVTR